MNLKKSFEYQNFLNKMIAAVEGYLIQPDNTTVTTETHVRSKANKDATDETIVAPRRNPSDHSINQFVDFLIVLLNEKEALTKAIDEAKAGMDINMDSSVAMNKKRQEVAAIFNSMARLKANEGVRQGVDYKMDINGCQTRYYYDVKTVTTIDFDRNVVKGLASKLTKEADEVSAALDLAQIQTEVKFDVKFDMTDSVEDAMEAYFG